MKMKQRNKGQRGKRLLTLLFWIYLLVLLRITVFREAFSIDHLMENGSLNLELFTAYIPFLQKGYYDLFIYLFVGNVVWFIPLGGYIICVYPTCSVWWAVLAGGLLSLGIEISQYVFGVGVTELDDLVLNITGACLGAIFIKVLIRIRERRNKLTDENREDLQD